MWHRSGPGLNRARAVPVLAGLGIRAPAHEKETAVTWTTTVRCAVVVLGVSGAAVLGATPLAHARDAGDHHSAAAHGIDIVCPPLVP